MFYLFLYNITTIINFHFHVIVLFSVLLKEQINVSAIQ